MKFQQTVNKNNLQEASSNFKINLLPQTLTQEQEEEFSNLIFHSLMKKTYGEDGQLLPEIQTELDSLVQDLQQGEVHKVWEELERAAKEKNGEEFTPEEKKSFFDKVLSKVQRAEYMNQYQSSLYNEVREKCKNMNVQEKTFHSVFYEKSKKIFEIIFEDYFSLLFDKFFQGIIEETVQ